METKDQQSSLVESKGETITSVNGNVSFFAGKRLQNSWTCKRSPLIITCKWECIIVKCGENIIFCV